jgi:hypothetical protein
MNIATNGPNVTRVTPAQSSWFSSYRAVEPSSCCKANARGTSLLGVQAQLQVSVANHHHGPQRYYGTLDEARFEVQGRSRLMLDAATGKNNQGLHMWDQGAATEKILHLSTMYSRVA